MRNCSQRGVSLYLSLLILSLLLAIALGGSTLFLGQVSRLKSAGNAVLALYAADAGIERALFIDNKNCATSPSVQERVQCVQAQLNSLTQQDKTLANGALFALELAPGGSGFCPAGKNYCVKSTGTFQNSTRSLRIAR